MKINNKTNRIIAIIGVLIIGGMFFYSIIEQMNRNIDRFQQSTTYEMSDFSEKEYQIKEVWVREFEHANTPSLNQAYIFLEVENEKFHFNFGSQFSDFGKNNDNINELLKYLNIGDSVKILANKNDIAYASDNSWKQKIIDFCNGTNKEVEVYKLTIAGKTIINQDIRYPSSSNRGFADVANQNLLKFILVAAFFISIMSLMVNFIQTKIKKTKS